MTEPNERVERCVLEVIVTSVEDAIRAAEGGADRLEVLRGIEVGGLTPSIDLVRDIQSAVQLPLRVMLRENQGYGLCETIAVERLCCLAGVFNEMKVDGVVLGFLKSNMVDVKLTQKVLSGAPGLKGTFHHAFEDTADKYAAIADLKTIPQIDKILSHGGEGALSERISNLGRYASAAGPEMSLVAGGGIDESVMETVRSETSVKEFHVGSAARGGGKVVATRVAALVSVLKKQYG